MAFDVISPLSKVMSAAAVFALSAHLYQDTPSSSSLLQTPEHLRLQAQKCLDGKLHAGLADEVLRSSIIACVEQGNAPLMERYRIVRELMHKYSSRPLGSRTQHPMPIKDVYFPFRA